MGPFGAPGLRRRSWSPAPRSCRAKWSHALKSAAVDVEIVTPELDQFEAIGLGDYQGHRTLLVSARPLNMRDRILKRTLDLAIAVPALIALLPVMIAVSIAIRAESGGPVLFRQQRVGRTRCRLAQVPQLLARLRRSHRRSLRKQGRFEDDFRVGGFIRRTSLDELPQLLNVIVGDMSIVGPRPRARLDRGGRAVLEDRRALLSSPRGEAGDDGPRPDQGLSRGDCPAARSHQPAPVGPRISLQLVDLAGHQDHRRDVRGDPAPERILGEGPALAGATIRSVALILMLTLSADLAAESHAVSLTGEVAWPGIAPGAAIEGSPDGDVVTLEGMVPSAAIGPATVRDAYRVVYVSREATVGRFAVDGLSAEVTYSCIRAHADVVVVRNMRCVMTGDLRAGG